jgi:hypothetical protein
MGHVKSPEVIRDRRRFKETSAPTGRARASAKGVNGTRFPNKLLKWSGATRETIFKDGAHNRKIGGDVLVGDLRGAYLITLALEERATCPTSCGVWDTCYGNNMQNARRWVFSKALMAGMAHELEQLCKRYPGVLVRLHVLGDFPNKAYIDFWDSMLRMHRNLWCFGFTAHGPDTVGGRMIAALRDKYPGRLPVRSRFAIRHSETPGPWGSEIVQEAEDPPRGAIICPEQLDSIDGNHKKTHCGSCAVCWQSDVNVRFIEH